MPSIRMILDHIHTLPLYLNYHPRLHQVWQFLETMPWRTMEPGKYPIDGTKLYAIIEEAHGKTPSQAILEAHKRYIDLQMCQAGEDLIGWKPLENCLQIRSSDEAKDLTLFNDKPDLWLPVHKEQFAIFAPHDAHAPLGCEGSVIKLIFKIAVD